MLHQSLAYTPEKMKNGLLQWDIKPQTLSHRKSVDMDMDMDVKFHIHSNPADLQANEISQTPVHFSAVKLTGQPVI